MSPPHSLSSVVRTLRLVVAALRAFSHEAHDPASSRASCGPVGERPQVDVEALVPGAGLDLAVADEGSGVELLRGSAEAQIVDLEAGGGLAEPHSGASPSGSRPGRSPGGPTHPAGAPSAPSARAPRPRPSHGSPPTCSPRPCRPSHRSHGRTSACSPPPSGPRASDPPRRPVSASLRTPAPRPRHPPRRLSRGRSTRTFRSDR